MNSTRHSSKSGVASSGTWRMPASRAKVRPRSTRQRVTVACPRPFIVAIPPVPSKVAFARSSPETPPAIFASASRVRTSAPFTSRFAT